MILRTHAAVLAFAAGLVVTASATAPASDADTVLWLGGTRVDAIPEDFFGDPRSFLGGAYADDDFVTVDYPASLLGPSLGDSVRIGVTNTVALVTGTTGPLVVAGVSQGAFVVQEVQGILDGDPAVPSDTTFVMIANPNTGLIRDLHGVPIPVLDYTPRPLPETRFATTVVVNEYDPMSDPVTRPWNPIADLNALMALVYVHPFAPQADLATVPGTNITTVTNSRGGMTTTYLVPTPRLPLTMPLRQMGLPDEVVDRVDAVLRPVVDAGYVRNRPATVTTAGVVAAKRSATASAPLRGSSSPLGATGTSARRSPVR